MKFAVDFSVEEDGKKRPEYTLESDLNGDISLADFIEYTRSALIVTADTVLRDEQSMGFDRQPVVVVDGRQGKPVTDVKPFGTIEFVSRANMDDIIIDAYEGILFRSRVDTGLYKSSNYVFHNGTQVASDIQSLKSWLKSGPKFEEKDLIRFVNIQPYARKLERQGVTEQRQQSRTVKPRDKKKSGGRILVPNGTYYLTARSLRSKYKRNSIIKFSFISGGQLGITGSFRAKRGKPGRPYLYPTIIISVQESGNF